MVAMGLLPRQEMRMYLGQGSGAKHRPHSRVPPQARDEYRAENQRAQSGASAHDGDRGAQPTDACAHGIAYVPNCGGPCGGPNDSGENEVNGSRDTPVPTPGQIGNDRYCRHLSHARG